MILTGFGSDLQLLTAVLLKVVDRDEIAVEIGRLWLSAVSMEPNASLMHRLTYQSWYLAWAEAITDITRVLVAYAGTDFDSTSLFVR